MTTNRTQIVARTGVVRWGLPRRRIASVLGILWLTTLLTGPGVVFGAAPTGGYSVKLTWDRSPSLGVAGYRIYYGPASGNYTNSVMAGNVTSNSIPGLTGGGTYFFIVVAYDAGGVESLPSNEVIFVPGIATLRISIATNRRAILTVIGPVGRTYEIQAAQPPGTWAVIGTGTIGANGSFSFTDTNAPGFPRRFYRTRETQP
jgi:hypothetical protein